MRRVPQGGPCAQKQPVPASLRARPHALYKQQQLQTALYSLPSECVHPCQFHRISFPCLLSLLARFPRR